MFYFTGQSVQKENARPRSQQDDMGKKGGYNDANNKNMGNKKSNRRSRRRSYTSATRPNKGDDMKQRNGAPIQGNMVAAN